LLGLLFQCGELHWVIPVKLAMVAVFLLLTSPTAGHALVKAAAAHGVRFVSVGSSDTAPGAPSAASPVGEGGA
jgi:multisubunit Na+/H+ antiporter MnhG subunit